MYKAIKNLLPGNIENIRGVKLWNGSGEELQQSPSMTQFGRVGVMVFTGRMKHSED